MRARLSGPSPRRRRSTISPPSRRSTAATPGGTKKTHKEEIAKERAEHIKAEEAHGGIHMPDQSWYPFLAAAGLLIGSYNAAQLKHPVILFGNQVLSTHIPLAIAGGAIMVLACYLWSLEGPGGYHIHLDEKGNAKESRGGYHH